MANIFTSQNLRHDYTNFESSIFEDTNKILFNKGDIELSKLKKLHNSIYSIALIAKKEKLKAKQNHHKYIFLSEMLSDALTIPALLIQGFNSSAFILLRRITENYYHHIFYYDHPIEFEQLNDGLNEYYPILKYKEYSLKHPNYNQTQDLLIKTSSEKIFLKYQDLCKIVHSKGINYMTLANNITNIKNKSLDINAELQELNNIYQAITYLLIKFHSGINFTNIEKRTLSDSLPPASRQTVFIL